MNSPSRIPEDRWAGHACSLIQLIIETDGYSTLPHCVFQVSRSDNSIAVVGGRGHVATPPSDPDVTVFCFLKDCREFSEVYPLLAHEAAKSANEDLLRWFVDALGRSVADRLRQLAHPDQKIEETEPERAARIARNAELARAEDNRPVVQEKMEGLPFFRKRVKYYFKNMEAYHRGQYHDRIVE